jgi:phosphate ABC transporter phosphate-binding protein
MGSLVGVQLLSLEGASASVTVTGTGSSYAAVAINNWVSQVANQDGISINYQTQSSVLGLDAFALNQVDFGASEIGYSSNQASSTPNFPYQYMPDVAGGECIMYQLPSATQQPISNLQLSPAVMMDIFSGKITTWNSPEIAALNPGVALPNHPIVVVIRSDASGDNYIFSQYLDTLEPAAWTAFASAVGFSPNNSATALWPTPTGGAPAGYPGAANFVGQSGSDNASNYVGAQPYSITYVETAYAILHNQPCAAVQNASGNFVTPSSTGEAIALTHDALFPDLEQNLAGVFSAPEGAAYPISAYSYLVSRTTGIDPEKAQVLAKFIEFFACGGQVSAGALGYSPIPPVLIQDDFDAISRLGITPPPLNAQTCPNPYLTGAATYVGGPIQLQSGGSGDAASALNGPTSTAVSNVKQVSAAAVSSKLLAKKKGGAQAAPGQEFGTALDAEVSRLLSFSGPTAGILFGTLAFLAVLIVPPAIIALRRRHAMMAAAATEAGAPPGGDDGEVDTPSSELTPDGGSDQ